MLLLLVACTSPAPDAPAPDALGSTPQSPPPPEEPRARIFVNELSASNDAGPADETGGHPDWIELYAPGPDDFPLAGLTLSDDDDDPGRHPLDPSLVVPGGGWLLLYADDQPEQGPTHASFELDVDGDDVGLYDGDTALSHLRFGPLLADASIARVDDGGADLAVTLSPTPGAANGVPAATLGPVDAEPAEDCEPVVTVAEPYPLEGAELVMTVACETGADPVGALLSATVGPTLRGAEIRWATGPADAGAVDVLVVIDGPSGVPETARGSAAIVDHWQDPANVLVDPTTYDEELGLPVLHVDPSAPLTQEYVTAQVWFEGVAYPATIKIRGAASAGYPKNSFTMEFEPEQIALDTLGLGNKDHLVLISNFDDNAYVRQKLVFDTWAALATASGETRLVPRTAFVALYLDGVYHGLYTAADHVDDEFVEEMGFDPTGNVYKSVTHDANFYLTNTAGEPKSTLHDGWEKKEGLPIDDFADLDALTAFTGAADHAAFDAEADRWLVRTEFTDWFLLVHWFAADDSGGKNAYLFHDPATDLFRYVPWDFNHALGQNWYTARIGPDAYNDFIWTNRVFWQLEDDPTSAEVLWERFAAQRAPGGPLDPLVLQSQLDALYVDVERAASRDWERWGDDYWAYFGWAHAERNGFVEERAYLEQWVAERAAWLDVRYPP